jgi:hypothetical protein
LKIKSYYTTKRHESRREVIWEEERDSGGGRGVREGKWKVTVIKVHDTHL